MGDLCRISAQDLWVVSLYRIYPLHKRSVQDLRYKVAHKDFLQVLRKTPTGARHLWEDLYRISAQDLLVGPLDRISRQDSCRNASKDPLRVGSMLYKTS